MPARIAMIVTVMINSIREKPYGERRFTGCGSGPPLPASILETHRWSEFGLHSTRNIDSPLPTASRTRLRTSPSPETADARFERSREMTARPRSVSMV